MKNLMWLIKREYWENKNLYLKAPAVIGVLLLILIAVMVFNKMPSQAQMYFEIKASHGGKVTTETISIVKQDMILRSSKTVEVVVGAFYVAFAFFFVLICSMVSYSYLSSALLADRQDKSILFWKSLPISETTIILSKLAFPLVLGPLIALIVAEIVFIFVILIVSVVGWFYDIPISTIYANNWTAFFEPLRMLALLPVYFLWALPTVAWFLMVSAWSKSRAILWAFGVPLLLAAVVVFAEKQMGLNLNFRDWLGEILSRFLIGTFPGAWMGESIPKISTEKDLAKLLLIAKETLAGWKIWAGAAVGVLMLYATVQLRRHRTEV
jgi:ABC-2 type transport system permease protein